MTMRPTGKITAAIAAIVMAVVSAGAPATAQDSATDGIGTLAVNVTSYWPVSGDGACVEAYGADRTVVAKECGRWSDTFDLTIPANEWTRLYLTGFDGVPDQYWGQVQSWGVAASTHLAPGGHQDIDVSLLNGASIAGVKGWCQFNNDHSPPATGFSRTECEVAAATIEVYNPVSFELITSTEMNADGTWRIDDLVRRPVLVKYTDATTVDGKKLTDGYYSGGVTSAIWDAEQVSLPADTYPVMMNFSNGYRASLAFDSAALDASSTPAGCVDVISVHPAGTLTDLVTTACAESGVVNFRTHGGTFKIYLRDFDGAANGWHAATSPVSMANASEVTFSAKVTYLRLALHPGAQLSGTVTRDGQPVTTGCVEAQWFATVTVETACLDDAGHYAFNHLPVTTDGIMMRLSGMSDLDDHWYPYADKASDAARVTVTTDQPHSLDFDIGTPRHITGTVTTAAGTSATSGCITAVASAIAEFDSACVDSTGRYDLAVPPGEYTLRLDGFAYDGWYGPSLTQDDAAHITVTTDRTVDITLPGPDDTAALVAIARFEALEASQWENSSWRAAATEYDALRAALRADTTQVQLDAAAAVLVAALDALIPAGDWSEADGLYASATQLDRSAYTTSSLAELDRAIEMYEQKTGEGAPVLGQSQVTYVVFTLTNALDNLVLRGQWDEAHALYEEAVAMDRSLYRPASMEVLDECLRAYEALLEDADDASQMQVDSIASALDEAISALRAVITFEDVCDAPGTPCHSAFHTEIAWLAGHGITTGWDTPAGRQFRPFDAITRDAMAAFLYRFAGEPTWTPPAESPFTDVSTSQPFFKEIAWLVGKNITTGWNDGGSVQYRPFNAITRDAMAAFLYRFAGEPDWTPPAKSPFTDVSPSQPFYAEITWLADTGITTGWTGAGGKEFRPYSAITRDAMAAFLYRFAGTSLT